MSFQIKKVTSLPDPLEANTMYAVSATPADQYAEIYFTSSDATAVKGLGNTAMITAISQALINTALAGKNAFQIAGTITDRDGLTHTSNALVLVTDASEDTTVNTGAALYAWDDANTLYTKLTEFESMDVTLTWAAIQGKPASAVADIDDAVTKRHTHTNKAQIDKISETNSVPYYDGDPLVRMGATDW